MRLLKQPFRVISFGNLPRSIGCTVVGVVLLSGERLAADVFPSIETHSKGSRNGIYLAVRGSTSPPLSAARISAVQASEARSREFFAEMSGGTFDFSYSQVLDVPITLDHRGFRPSDWHQQAEQYVRSNYGIEPDSYFINAFDVSATRPDPEQGWAGLYVGGNDFFVQSDYATWGQNTHDHELGHLLGTGHAHSWSVENSLGFTPYIWDADSEAYAVYNPAIHGHQPTAYGGRLEEYGNPFDTMGNTATFGHMHILKKLENMQWLTEEQVPDLDELGGGVHRIYAHDELQHITAGRGATVYGVDETYDPNAFYGLRYTRPAERFNVETSVFEPYEQTITLEYRSGRDGGQFYIDHGIVDLDAEGGTDYFNLERELEVGQSIRDADFGMSIFQPTFNLAGIDFLSFNPPPPSDPSELASKWFEFEVLGLGSDAIGSYIEIDVSLIQLQLEGDVNGDGLLTSGDLDAFSQHWKTDTTALAFADRYRKGDLNADGLTDLHDLSLLRQAFANAGLGAGGLPLATVPEPCSISLMFAGGMLCGICRRKNNCQSNVGLMIDHSAA